MRQRAAGTTLQVYVSSTWLDLQPERAAILRITHELRGLQFRGMEFFGSRDATTVRTSVDEVYGADAYIGIVGHRYGSGITEDEYARAQELRIPALIYFKEEEPAGALSSQDTSDRQRLEAFRQRLRENHTCSSFRDADDLAVRVVANLHNWMFDHHLSQGLALLATDYTARVKAFVAQYIGSGSTQVPFGGRARELGVLERWLDELDAPPFLLVTAGAGKGKSALLVRWMSDLLRRPDIALVFFPVSIRFRTNLASVVFPSLATCLAGLDGELLNMPPDTPPEVWRGAVTDLISRPRRDGRRLVVIVDGLDEAADWTAGADLFPSHARHGARVVVAARILAGDVDAGDWLHRLGWDAPDVARTLSLAPLEPAEVSDVLVRMGLPLSDLGARSEVVYELYRLSTGEPLIIRLYVDDLVRRGPALGSLKLVDLRAIEPGLGGFFDHWWKDQRGLWGSARPMQERRVQVLMSVLASALGPLTRDDLFGIAAPLAEMNTWTLEEALDPLQRFIVGDGSENGYVYSHPGLAIHFRERLSRKERESLDERVLAWCGESVEAVSEDLGEAGPLSSYVLQYFGAHLERLQADITRFAPLLTDAWRRAWHAQDGSHAGYRADLGRIQAAALRTTDRQLGGSANALPLAVRAALCSASVDQLAANTPPELVVALVEKGVWNRASAVGYARLIRSPERRARALVNVALVATETARPQVVREAISALEQVPDEDRVPLLLRLAPLLSFPLFDDALAVALSIDRRSLMVDAIVGLSPFLNSTLLNRAFAAVSALADTDLRQRGFRALAAIHPREFERKASEPGINPWEQAWILLHVSDRLGPEHGAEACRTALAAANRMGNDVARLELLVAIAERASAGERDAVVQDVRRRLASVTLPSIRARMLLRLVTLVDPSAARALVGEILDTCARIDSSFERSAVLVSLTPNLLQSDVSAAFSLAQGIEDPGHWAAAVAALLPHLSVAAKQEVLVRIHQIDDPFDLVCTAAAVAPHLDELLVAKLRQVEWADVASPLWRFRLVQILAPVVPQIVPASPLAYDSSLGELAHLAAGARFCHPSQRRSVDQRVAALLRGSDGILGDALPETVQFLTHWAATASAPSLATVVTAILDWRSATARVVAVDALSAYLPVAVLETAVRRMQEIADAEACRQTKIRCLAALPPHRVLGDRADLWAALSGAERLTQMLQWFQEGWADDLTLRGAILTVLPHVADSGHRAHAVEVFARDTHSGITRDELRKLVGVAQALDQSLLRASAMCCLLPYLQAEGSDRSADILSALIYDSDEATKAAAAVAASLTAQEVLQTIERLAGAHLDENLIFDGTGLGTVKALLRLLPHLDPAIQPAAIHHLIAALAAGVGPELGRVLYRIKPVATTPEFFDRFFTLSERLPAEEHWANVPILLPRMTAAVVRGAIRRLHATTVRVGEPAGGLAQDPPTGQAHRTDRLWFVELVVKYLSVLQRPADEDLATLAYHDLRREPIDSRTTNACIALMSLAPDELTDRLVGLAVEGLKGRSDDEIASALKDLDRALPTLAPYFSGKRIRRFTHLLVVALGRGTGPGKAVAMIGARLPRSEVAGAVVAACSREFRSEKPWSDAGWRLASILNIAGWLGDEVREASIAAVRQTITTSGPPQSAEMLVAVADNLSPDPHLFEALFAVAMHLPDEERLQAAFALLRGLGPAAVEPALLAVLAWCDALPRSVVRGMTDRARRRELFVPPAAWRAAVVLRGIGALAAAGDGAPVDNPSDSPDVQGPALASLASMAFDDIQTRAPEGWTTQLFTALMPYASADVQTGLTTIALASLRHLPDYQEKAAELAGLAAHAPAHTMGAIVDQLLEFRQGAATVTAAAESEVVRLVMARGSTAHARQLMRAVGRQGASTAVCEALVEHLPDLLLLEFVDATAHMPGLPIQLYARWAARSGKLAVDDLASSMTATRPRWLVAMALSHCVPYASGHAGDSLKGLALEAAIADPDLDVGILLEMREAAGKNWPELESLVIDMLLKRPSPLDLMKAAVDLLPDFTGELQTRLAAAATCALRMMGPDPQTILELSVDPPVESLPQVLRGMCAARFSVPGRSAILLPMVGAAHRGALAASVTETPDWLHRYELYEPVVHTMSDPAVANTVVGRLTALPQPTVCSLLNAAESRGPVLSVLGSLSADSTEWRFLFLHLMCSAAEGSRADLMRLLSSLGPALYKGAGCRAIEDIIESLDEVSAWWP